MRYRLALNVPVPLSDGTLLSASVFRPSASGTYPVIFVVTPYTADRWVEWGAFFAANGYIFVCVDARGRGNSGGVFEPWVNEGRDGVDIIRVLSTRLPGSDGRVAAWGGSYSGKNQWAFAVAHEPALKTIAPAATGYPGYDLGMLRNVPMPSMMRWLAYVSGRAVNSNLNRDDRYWAGAYAALARGAVTYRRFDGYAGFPSRVWQDWATHPDFDDFWRRGTPTTSELEGIQIPVLAVTGTYDDAQLGTLRYWQQYQGNAAPKPNGFLVIGPWDHPGTRDPQLALGGLTFGARSRLDIHALNLEWYDWVLKHKARPAALKDHFNFYIAGADRWDSAPTLGAATGRRETLYLASPLVPASSLRQRGALTSVAPRPDADSYVDDPGAAPFNEGPEGETALGPDYLASDPVGARLRGDGLVYETAPFANAVELVGQPTASLTLSIDGPDADVRVMLFEVHRDGRIIFLSQDQIRARYRSGSERAELLQDGRPLEYRFDQFHFVARRIAKESRIRLVVAPLGASIYQQRNRHSGKLVVDEVPADNRVISVRALLGPGVSRISLPVGRGQPALFESVRQRGGR